MLLLGNASKIDPSNLTLDQCIPCRLGPDEALRRPMANLS